MTKVGILSMQRIQNYGSFLQAYGLKHILEDIGCEVQFVDYHPGKTLIPTDGNTIITRKILKVADVLKQNGPLKEKLRFIKYKKNYARNYYPYLGITEERNYSPDVDLLVIGSDEVFNCVQNNANVGFSPDLFGQGNNAKKVISYAASFGNTTVEKLKQYGVKDKVTKWLRAFDAISVRDKNSGEIVKELIGAEPNYNFDPVLIYDFSSQCERIQAAVPDKNYMLLYGYTGRFSKEECKQIREFADNKELKIICIGGIQSCCDKFIDVDPFTVISYFQHADYVVTDTFHGTILSVITHRQFVSVIRNSGYGNGQKLTDLLERLDLTDRSFDDTLALGEKLTNTISYKKVDTVLKQERKKTIEFLKQWVE